MNKKYIDNKSSLIKFSSCIIVLLIVCYFGTIGSKETHSVNYFSCANGTTPFTSSDGTKGYCCDKNWKIKSGTTSCVSSVYTSSNAIDIIADSNGGANCRKVATTSIQANSYESAGYICGDPLADGKGGVTYNCTIPCMKESVAATMSSCTYGSASSDNIKAYATVTTGGTATATECCQKVNWRYEGGQCVTDVTTGLYSYYYSAAGFNGWCATKSGYSLGGEYGSNECFKCKDGYYNDNGQCKLIASSSSSSSSPPSSSSSSSKPPSSSSSKPSSSSSSKPSSSSLQKSSSSAISKPVSSSNQVIVNPQTGETMFFIVWMIALAAIVYSVWYFKSTKKTDNKQK